MELIEVVDENGDFTGEVLDKDIVHDRNLFHNEVAVFVINDQNQLLLQKRSANKRYNPNKWALCAGHVDAYESLENAVLREMKEEIGLDVPKSELYPYAERDKFVDDSNSHFTYYYYVKTNKKEDEFTVQLEELSEVKWVDIDAVIEMIKNKDDSTSTIFDEQFLDLFLGLKKLNGIRR